MFEWFLFMAHITSSIRTQQLTSLSPLRTNYFTTLAPHVKLDMELKLLKVNSLLNASINPITLTRNVRLTLKSDTVLKSSLQSF